MPQGTEKIITGSSWTGIIDENRESMSNKVLYQIVALDEHNKIHHYIGDIFYQREGVDSCLRQMSDAVKSLYKYEIQEIKL